MKKLQSSYILKLTVLVFFFLLLSESSNAQFTDSTALFVVDINNVAWPADSTISERLTDMGFEVEIIDMNDVSDASTEGMSLVLISATVGSGTVADNMPGLIDLEIPVINWEPFIYDVLGYSELDGGEFNTTEIVIVNEDHPLAAGLSADIITISIEEKAVSYGVPEGDAVIIAINPLDETQAVLFGYDTGAEMFSGNAPARRVGTFLLNDVADAMTDEGWELFDASVKWAMNFQDTSTAVDGLELDIPTEFILHNNYPNPFNQSTVITYSIPIRTGVELTVYDLKGKEVACLENDFKDAGIHTISFNAQHLASGVYFYKLKTGSNVFVKKMAFLK